MNYKFGCVCVLQWIWKWHGLETGQQCFVFCNVCFVFWYLCFVKIFDTKHKTHFCVLEISTKWLEIVDFQQKLEGKFKGLNSWKISKSSFRPKCVWHWKISARYVQKHHYLGWVSWKGHSKLHFQFCVLEMCFVCVLLKFSLPDCFSDRDRRRV